MNSACEEKKAKSMMEVNDMVKKIIRHCGKCSEDCDTQCHAEQNTVTAYERIKSGKYKTLFGIITAFVFIVMIEARVLSIFGKGPKFFEVIFLFTALTLYCLGYLFIFRKKELYKIDLLCALSAFAVSSSIQITDFIVEQNERIFASGKDAAVFLLLCLFFYLLFFCIKNFWLRDFEIVSNRKKLKDMPQRKNYVFLALLFGLILLRMYMIFFPYGSSPDTVNQWEQIHGVLPYNRIHAIGHTIFLKGLLSIYDNYMIVIVFHILWVMAIYLLFSNYFLSKGFPVWSVATVFAFSLIVELMAKWAYFYPLKDTPAALCICLTTLILMKYSEEKKIGLFSATVLGFALAWCWLFRLNGIIVFCVMGAYFSFSFIKHRYFRQLSLMLAAIILSVGFVNIYTDKCLKPAEYENGFSIQVFASGIAAMVDSGELSDEELERIDEFISVDWMQSNYSRFKKNMLIWEIDGEISSDEPELEIFNNKFVLDLGANKQQIIKLYFELMPRHLAVCIKDIFGSIFMMWKTPLVFTSSYFFSVLMIVLLAVSARLKLKDSIIFLPSLCNTVSIMISTITNEGRYLLPAFMLMPVFFLYIVQKNIEYKEQNAEPVKYD